MVEHLQIGAHAQVRQQQQAACDVLRHDGRHRYAGGAEQRVDLDEGRHILAFRRGVHDDQRGAQFRLARARGGQHVDPEIAAEAGVGRRRACRRRVDQIQRGEPVLQQDQAGVGAAVGAVG
jgi:hypothetical protein